MHKCDIVKNEYDAAKKWAEIYNKELTADLFKYNINIEHNDGSVFNIKNIIAQINNDFLIVYSEHNSYFVFFREDLKNWDIDNFQGIENIEDFIISFNRLVITPKMAAKLKCPFEPWTENT